MNLTRCIRGDDNKLAASAGGDLQFLAERAPRQVFPRRSRRPATVKPRGVLNHTVGGGRGGALSGPPYRDCRSEK